MTKGAPLGHLFLYAVPLLLGNWLQLAYNAVDSIIAGRFIGQDALAAEGVAGPVMNLVILAISGLCIGAGVLMSEAFGAKRTARLKETLATTLLFGAALCCAAAALGCALTPWILRTLAVPDSIFGITGIYLRITFLGAPFTFFYNALAAGLKSVGDSKTPLKFLAFSAVLNAVLDLILIGGLGFGIVCSAVTTVVAEAASALLAAVYMARRVPELCPGQGQWRIRRDLLGPILRYGAVTAVQQAVQPICKVLIQGQVNALGVGAIAAFNAVTRVDDFAFTPEQSIATAITTYIAQNRGAGQTARIRRGFAVGLRLELGYWLLMGSLTLLLRRGIQHTVLNAKFHEKEAEIVAQAGKVGAVTIATNMAGRGTDILLGGNPEFLAKRKLREEGVDPEAIELATSFITDIPDDIKEIRKHYWDVYEEFKKQTDAEKEKVIAAGGLHILGTERHESRRIDNQLRGRSGRQGDAGSSQFFISLEDDLIKRFGGERLQSVYNFFKVKENEPLQAKMLSRSIENAQRAIEGRNFGIRKHVLEYDDVMNKQREVMYAERLKVLKAENVHEDILKLIPEYAKYVVSTAIDNENKPETWDIGALNKAIEAKLLPPDSNFMTRERALNWDYEYMLTQLNQAIVDAYEAKIARYKEEGLNFYEIEKIVLLKNVDGKWIDHIDAMDQLRKGISLRSYGGVDPVIEYKKEGREMFEDMTISIQDDTISVLLKAELQKVPVRRPAVEDRKDLVTNQEGPAVPKRAAKSVGRNDPCPCGSGKKYKNCCGRNV